jgi:hypothetical protein
MTVIETQTKPRADSELQALEALWEAPAAQPDVPRRRNVHGIRRPLGFAWGFVLVSLFLAPAPEADVAIPWWSWTLFGVFMLAVVGMFAAFAMTGMGLSLGASLLAGALGVALGVGCLATEHHPGGWAIYELGAFSALAIASAVGLGLHRAAAKPR